VQELTLKLSPSSASDFKSCPQLFKYRSIDRMPEPVSPGAARGSLVHSVLERLFSIDAEERTASRAQQLLDSTWSELRAEEAGRPDGLDDVHEREWLEESRVLLGNYFKLEDPSKLDPRRLEWWVEYELSDIELRGIVDRLEVTPNNHWILTDYKTGRIPHESRELAAFFGLRFYALVCWRAFGVMAEEIRLVYLADPAVLTLNPNERMLLAFERQIRALGKAIRRAADLDDWRPRPSPFCMSCAFQAHCPAWTQVDSKPG
jgi:putative RecB family exonuclease